MMAQNHKNMICIICGKENPHKHQDFCLDLGCSGRMIVKTKGDFSMAQHPVNIRTLTSEKLSHRLYVTGMARATAEGQYFLLDEGRKILLDKLAIKISEDGISHTKSQSLARISDEYRIHIEGQAVAKENLYIARANYSECDFEIKRRLNLSFSKNKEWNSGKLTT